MSFIRGPNGTKAASLDSLMSFGNRANLDFEMTNGGLEIRVKDGSDVYTLTVQREKKPSLTPLETTYLAALIRFGYISTEEFYFIAHNAEDDHYNVMAVIIHNLRKKIGRNTIKQRSGSRNWGNWYGGYFIGNLGEHRNEAENLRKYDCFSLNAVTGHVVLPDGSEAFLGPMHADLVGRIVLSRSEGITVNDLYDAVYQKMGPSRVKKETISVHIHNINRRLDPDKRYIVMEGGKYALNPDLLGSSIVRNSVLQGHSRVYRSWSAQNPILSSRICQ